MNTAPPTRAPRTTYGIRSSVWPRRRASATNTAAATSTPSATNTPWVGTGTPRTWPRSGYTGSGLQLGGRQDPELRGHGGRVGAALDVIGPQPQPDGVGLGEAVLRVVGLPQDDLPGRVADDDLGVRVVCDHVDVMATRGDRADVEAAR